MLYQVGEKVRVKENAKDINSNNVFFASPDMDKYCGNVYVVRSCASGIYTLEDVSSEDKSINDDGYWLWVEDWLEPVGAEYNEIENDEIMNLFI